LKDLQKSTGENIAVNPSGEKVYERQVGEISGADVMVRG